MKGARVVLTTRRVEPLREWAERHGDRVLLPPLDVTDAGQVDEAASTSWSTTRAGMDFPVGA